MWAFEISSYTWMSPSLLLAQDAQLGREAFASGCSSTVLHSQHQVTSWFYGVFLVHSGLLFIAFKSLVPDLLIRVIIVSYEELSDLSEQ